MTGRGEKKGSTSLWDKQPLLTHDITTILATVSQIDSLNRIRVP